ncbi:MAG: GDP-L-fucose synthase [Blastocatellia bacterium]|nr:GDP-L-fucose synthase [Blastocatellia bacterium]
MKSPLADRRICVTGGAEFLGRSVVARLEERGCSRVFVARQSDYDLTRWEDVERMYGDARPQVVVHLAAVTGGILANLESPGRFFYENLIMGAQIMEGARLHSVEKFIHTGAACSYPKHTPAPFKEQDIWNGYPEETSASYGIAKRALLVQGQAYRDQYGLNAVYLLLANLYGPGDKFDPNYSSVIPALIKKCVDAVERGDGAIEVWGTGNTMREFLYVDDAAEGIVLAAENYSSREPVNLGSGREISIKELVYVIARETGFTGQIVWDATKPDGPPRRSLDLTRAAQSLGFRAETDFSDGLRRTIEWYRSTRGQEPQAKEE